MNKELILSQLDGKSEDDAIKFLKEHYNIAWYPTDRATRSLYAKVFTYFHDEELEEEINFFLWLLNLLAKLFHFCFTIEDTELLGRSNPCGKKQAILYFSINRKKDYKK